MAARKTSIVTIFRIPETGCFGYSYHFAGDKPHYAINTCVTLQQALSGCDSHLEHIWEEPDGSDPNVVMVSGLQPGTVMWQMTHLTLAELHAHRDQAA